MLNCTDLACILDHHHFYANLHHLKRHLDGHAHNHDDEADGTGSDIDTNNITELLNEPNTELSSLSHVDDPNNNVWFIICGVIIAMLSVGIIIILVAVTISKLRKREESSHVENSPEAQQPTHVVSTVEPIGFRQSPSSVWHFPPLPPQPNLYIYNATSQDALVHSDKLGLRGFRKQLSGRFKRLVSRKPQEPTTVIPPELKPQLKTIYVY